ncbi:VOC family protein [Scopulibacillus cellulosilyticus]|uniref:VOC family protein n=1 Tax=Scopulibacillus cellulosilyticus TaxID=2665665 RepID=A0ABW2PWL4_9BACL
MEYIGVHHVSLVVTELERAKHFYSNILGFNLIKRPNFDTEGAWYQIGNTQLHLIVYRKGKTFRGTTDLDRDDGHFAVQVEDIDAFIRHIKTLGVELLTVSNKEAGGERVYVSDPDGNLIEFKS